MSTFVDIVNRVFRINSIIGADDDDIANFSDTQHVASIQLAKIAIQGTLTELVSDRLIPAEEADGTITLVDGTRTYALPSDFIRFKGEKPFLLKLDASGNSENITVNEYPGGEEKLRRTVLDYREQSGEPIWWYPIQSSTKTIGLYHVPDSSVDGLDYRFPYEKSVYVADYNDTMPFSNDQENHAFAEMAARRFLFLFTKQPVEGLEQDSVYKMGKVNLSNLLRQTNPTNGYGYSYG